MMEKQILSTINHPFIIKFVISINPLYLFFFKSNMYSNYMLHLCRLYCTFHDEDYLYMCMDLAGGGELAKYIIAQQKKRSSEGVADAACNVEVTRFYVAELILALEYLHVNGIIHMDLKPESKNSLSLLLIHISDHYIHVNFTYFCLLILFCRCFVYEEWTY